MITEVYKNRRGVPVGAYVNHKDYDEDDEDKVVSMASSYFSTHNVRWVEEGAAGVHEDGNFYYYVIWLKTRDGEWVIEKPCGVKTDFNLSAFDELLVSQGFEEDEDEAFTSTGYVRYILHRKIHKFPSKTDIKYEVDPVYKQWMIDLYEKKTKESFDDWLDHHPDQFYKYYQNMIDFEKNQLMKEFLSLKRDRKVDRSEDYISWLKQAHPDEYERLVKETEIAKILGES